MKNSLKILVIFLVFSITTSHAQKTKVGIRAGIGLPNLRSVDDNVYSKDYESVAGFDGGIFGDFGITEGFSIKAELAFSRKGGERNGMQPIPSATLDSSPEGQALAQYLQFAGIETIYAEFDNKAVFSYIEIPILAKYEWSLSDTWGFYVNAGPYVSFIINPKQETKSNGIVPIYVDEAGSIPLMVPYPPDFQTLGPAAGDFTATTEIDKDLATMDFGALLGLGVTADISEHSELFFDIRGTYGFIPLQNDTDTYGSVHMGSVAFALGYSYSFDKKTNVAPKN